MELRAAFDNNNCSVSVIETNLTHRSRNGAKNAPIRDWDQELELDSSPEVKKSRACSLRRETSAHVIIMALLGLVYLGLGGLVGFYIYRNRSKSLLTRSLSWVLNFSFGDLSPIFRNCARIRFGKLKAILVKANPCVVDHQNWNLFISWTLYLFLFFTKGLVQRIKTERNICFLPISASA